MIIVSFKNVFGVSLFKSSFLNSINYLLLTPKCITAFLLKPAGIMLNLVCILFFFNSNIYFWY